MKKICVFVLLFVLTAGAQEQEKKLLEFAQRYYSKKNYNMIISYLNVSIRMDKIKDTDILSQMYLYLGFSYFQRGKEDIAIARLKNALKVNADCKLKENMFDNRTVQFFNRVKRETIGSMEIITEPDSAYLFVDHKLRGKTPLWIENIYEGIYNITLIKDGYSMSSEELIVKPGEKIDRKYPLNRNNKYSMFLTSSPPVAAVYLDELYKGSTPLYIDDLESKKYDLKIGSIVGFKDWTDIIEIPSEKEPVVTAELQRRRDYFLYSLLLPGAGQFTLGNRYHSFASAGLTAGLIIYYIHFSRKEPNWVYKDIEFVIGNLWVGNYIHKIDGEVVDSRTYSIELEKKRKEEIRINDWENKMERRMGLIILSYCLNLVDTIYLMDKRYKEAFERTVSVSIENDYNYLGMRLNVSF